MAKVSILMNGYNSQKYLKEAIDSVYAQTFTDWEIIFIDNCSTDDTKKIVDSYDKKIKYYKTNENIPLGAARNFGLKYCKGEYIAFLDTDDVWMCHKLAVQIEVMDKNKEFQLCYGGMVYIDKDSKEIGKTLPKAKSGDVLVQQFRRYEINMLSSLLRNNIEIKIDEKLRHSPDFDLFMNIASKYKVYVIKDYLVKYRKLKDSLTSKNIDIWWFEMKNSLDKIFLGNQKLKTLYPQEYRLVYAKVAYYKAQYLLSIGDKKGAIVEMSKFKFVNISYFLLYLTSLLPNKIWDLLHRYKG